MSEDDKTVPTEADASQEEQNTVPSEVSDAPVDSTAEEQTTEPSGEGEVADDTSTNDTGTAPKFDDELIERAALLDITEEDLAKYGDLAGAVVDAMEKQVRIQSRRKAESQEPEAPQALPDDEAEQPAAEEPPADPDAGINLDLESLGVSPEVQTILNKAFNTVNSELKETRAKMQQVAQQAEWVYNRAAMQYRDELLGPLGDEMPDKFGPSAKERAENQKAVLVEAREISKSYAEMGKQVPDKLLIRMAVKSLFGESATTPQNPDNNTPTTEPDAPRDDAGRFTTRPAGRTRLPAQSETPANPRLEALRNTEEWLRTHSR